MKARLKLPQHPHVNQTALPSQKQDNDLILLTRQSPQSAYAQWRSEYRGPVPSRLQAFVREFLLHDTSEAGSALRFMLATMVSITEVTDVEFTDVLWEKGAFLRIDGGSDTSKWRDVPLSRMAVAEYGWRTRLSSGDLLFSSKGKLENLRLEIRDILKLGKIGRFSNITEEFRNFATDLLNGNLKVPALVLGEDPFQRGRYTFQYDDPMWPYAKRLMEAWCRYLGLVPEAMTFISERQRG